MMVVVRLRPRVGYTLAQARFRCTALYSTTGINCNSRKLQLRAAKLQFKRFHGLFTEDRVKETVKEKRKGRCKRYYFWIQTPPVK